jgi:ferredoxin
VNELQVSIDETRCQGHALCLERSPENFEFDDVEGRAYVIEPTVAPSSADAVRQAMANCPERAITVS